MVFHITLWIAAYGMVDFEVMYPYMYVFPLVKSVMFPTLSKVIEAFIQLVYSEVNHSSPLPPL